MNFISRFILVVVCSLVLSVSSFAQKGEPGIGKTLDSLVSLPFFDSAIVSLDVHNLTSNSPVFSKNNKLPMRSASNMKILTAAAAWHYLGSERQITTKILSDGNVVNGSLRGNIYIKGGGDPLFELNDLDSLITQLKNAGIRTINGKVLPDVSLFDTVRWVNGWMWDDDPYSDAPYITPLSINRNAVEIEVRYDKDANSFDVSANPNTKFFKVINQIRIDTSSSTNLLYTHQWLGGRERIFVKGVWNPSDTTSREDISILRPEEFFLFIFKEKCHDAGIHIRNRTGLKNLIHPVCIAQQWHTVAEIVKVMNKTSNNLCAELLSRNLSSAAITEGITAENGLAYIDSLMRLTGFNPKNYRIADGSGASHYNVVTAELLNGILKYFYKNERRNCALLKNSFPQAGVDGTLRNRMTTGKAYKHIFAKTGTISGVSALSGYAAGQSGNEYSFSILMQINPRDLNRARQIQDAICELLASN